MFASSSRFEPDCVKLKLECLVALGRALLHSQLGAKSAKFFAGRNGSGQTDRHTSQPWVAPCSSKARRKTKKRKAGKTNYQTSPLPTLFFARVFFFFPTFNVTFKSPVVQPKLVQSSPVVPQFLEMGFKFNSPTLFHFEPLCLHGSCIRYIYWSDSQTRTPVSQNTNVNLGCSWREHDSDSRSFNLRIYFKSQATPQWL